MRACKFPPNPILRSEHEAESAAAIDVLLQRAALDPRKGTPCMNPGPNANTDPKTAAALTAAHAAYLDARTGLERLSKKRRAAVVKAYDGGAGWSVYMIARHLGVHDNVVSAILKAAKQNGE
jgi:hypothetical protein